VPVSVILGKSGRSTQVTDFATNQDLASQNVPTSLLTQNNFRFARDPTGIRTQPLQLVSAIAGLRQLARL